VHPSTPKTTHSLDSQDLTQQKQNESNNLCLSEIFPISPQDRKEVVMVLQPVKEHVQVYKIVHLRKLRLYLLQGVEGLRRLDVAAGRKNERH
jgi:hypothetical protein